MGMYAYASSLRRNKSSFTDFSGSVNKRTVKRRKIRYERTLLIAVRLFLNNMVICFYASCTDTDPPAGDGVLFLSVRARSWSKCFTTMTFNRWSQSPDAYNRIKLGNLVTCITVSFIKSDALNSFSLTATFPQEAQSQ